MKGPALSGAFALALVASAACSQETSAPAQSAETPNASATSQTAASEPVTVENFTLVDQHGESFELYEQTDAEAVVLVMQGNGCPIVRQMMPELKEVYADYADKGVEFRMINANIQDSPEKIADEMTEFGVDIPVLKDAEQSVGKALGAERTAEVFIVDPADWSLLYHGPIDDRLTYGRAKNEADNHYARNVLDALLAGDELPQYDLQADGCIINYVS